MNLTRGAGRCSARFSPHRGRVLAFGAVAALVAAGLSGCTSTLGYAALVNGTAISVNTLNQQLAEIAANKQFVNAIDQEGSGPVVGTAAGSYNKAFVAAILNEQVQYEVIRQELVARHALPTPAQVAAARPAAMQAYQTVFATFPARYQSLLVREQAEIDAFTTAATSDLSAAALNQYYQAHQSEYASETCVRHILIADTDASGSTINYPASLADAQTVEGLLNSGGDFAALAKQYSKDNQGTTGGSAAVGGMLAGSAPDGCLTPQDLQQLIAPFVDAVNTLPVNVVSQPVKTQFGYHLIEVTKRDVEPLDSTVTMDIHERIAGVRLTQLVTKAKVKVNPEFGSFNAKVDATSGQITGVIPPLVPNLGTTTTSTTVPPASGG